MLGDTHEEMTDKSRLLLGAGFVFGVAATMLVLAIATATVVGAGTLLGSPLGATIAASILFAGILGVSLYVLAFPENRLDLPVEQFVERHAGRFVETGQGHDEPITERL
jgi:hypothetical protein